MHTACPQGLSEAGLPCPVPGIFRVFAVWKRHSQEDECEEETNPPKQMYPTPMTHGTWPGQGKGLTAATTSWEDPPGLIPRSFIQCFALQRARSHSGLGQLGVVRCRGDIVLQLLATTKSCLPVAGQLSSAGFFCIFSTSPQIMSSSNGEQTCRDGLDWDHCPGLTHAS